MSQQLERFLAIVNPAAGGGKPDGGADADAKALASVVALLP